MTDQQYGCDYCRNPPPGLSPFGPGKLWSVDDRGNQVAEDCPKCLGLDRKKAFYGKYLAYGKHPKRLDLVEVLEDDAFKSVYHEKNVFLRGGDADVGNAILWALSNMWFRGGETGQWKYKTITDATLKGHKFGEIVAPGSKKERAISIEEAVSSPSLLIVELGILEGKNAGASSGVLEGLNVRANLGKPTWIVEGKRQFTEGHTCYSKGLEMAIAAFEFIEIGKVKPVVYSPPEGRKIPLTKSGEVAEGDLTDAISLGILGGSKK